MSTSAAHSPGLKLMPATVMGASAGPLNRASSASFSPAYDRSFHTHQADTQASLSVRVCMRVSLFVSDSDAQYQNKEKSCCCLFVSDKTNKTLTARTAIIFVIYLLYINIYLLPVTKTNLEKHVFLEILGEKSLLQMWKDEK